jgi:hypothetical protein
MTTAQKFLALVVVLPILISLTSHRYSRYQKKVMKSQRGITSIHGRPAHSLQTENMRIRASNRDKGVIGELGVAKDLEYLANEYNLTVLHDLSLPGSKANIDHILISEKVVYVIDAKNYSGIVKVVTGKDGVKRLRISGRDQTELVNKLRGYSEKVEIFLQSEKIPIKVVPILAFYKATFSNDSKVTINGVTVNVFGIENELLRYSNLKSHTFNSTDVAEKLIKGFPLKN